MLHTRGLFRGFPRAFNLRMISLLALLPLGAYTIAQNQNQGPRQAYSIAGGKQRVLAVLALGGFDSGCFLVHKRVPSCGRYLPRSTGTWSKQASSATTLCWRQALITYQSKKSLLRFWCLISYKCHSFFADLNLSKWTETVPAFTWPSSTTHAVSWS